jgi:hypothetical protein
MEDKMNGDVNRIEILKQVEAGQISAADAAAKLAPAKPALKLTGPTGRPRWFRVRVFNLDTDQPKVTVNLPMSWMQVGLSLGSRFAPELEGLDWNEIATALNDDTAGKIVEVEDLEKRERVEIFVE